MIKNDKTITDEIAAMEEQEAQIIELKEKLNNAEQSKLRALADLDNFRRRESESRANWSNNAVADWMLKILPSMQALLLGAEHTEDEDVKNVIKKFIEKIREQGLEKISPNAGEEINPEEHAVLMAAEGEPGTVVQVLESGWKLNGIVILPAKISGAPIT
jgi:molecular chaperone GrpE